MKLPPLAIVIAGGTLALFAGASHAANLSVYVGYADDLRASPFFPTPWAGSANTIFDGLDEAGNPGSHFDAGAVRIDNTGITAFTFDSAVVTFWNGVSFNLWGTHTVNPGEHLILTQTSTAENFDTSDVATFRANGDPVPIPETLHAPHITLTINGTTLPDFLDTGHVLDTGGYDTAFDGSNESLQWRLIGTTGINDPGGTGTPDAGSTVLLLSGGFATAAYLRRKRNS